MPTISSFYGILIMMFQSLKEHNPPHIHAYYGDDEATFLISSGDLFEWEFPERGKRLVKEFILTNQKDLQEMWDTEVYKRIPPLK